MPPERIHAVPERIDINGQVLEALDEGGRAQLLALADRWGRRDVFAADVEGVLEAVRDDRIAPDGEILDEWYELFLTFPDRFMIGIDTFSLSRWREYGEVARRIRQWVKQLPEETASKLLYGNAAALFNAKAEGSQY
mgnify:CR=1 FL=1